MRLRIWTFAVIAAVASCSPSVPRERASAAAATPAAGPVAAPASGAAAVALPPGRSVEQATAVTVGTRVAGEILPGGVSNFYRFDNPLKQRDIVLLRLDNKSATLRPQINIYNADRSLMVDKHDPTLGASLQQPISLDPGQTIYVEVTSAWDGGRMSRDTSGAYHLSAMPQRAYDANEPNDNQLTPTAITLGVSIEGSLMDEKDQDWFRVSGAQGARVSVVLDNLSATLIPHVKIYSSTKSEKLEKFDRTPGAGLDFVVEVDPGKDFYIQIVPHESAGKYKLLITAAR
jgi:hypothetical protein